MRIKKSLLLPSLAAAMALPVAAATVNPSLDLRGALIYDSSWPEEQMSHYGYFALSSAELGSGVENIFECPAQYWDEYATLGPGTFVWQGRMYSPIVQYAYGELMQSDLFIYDIATGQRVARERFNPNYLMQSSVYVPSLAGALACVKDYRTDDYKLILIGINGTVAEKGATGKISFLGGMAVTPEGTVYGLTASGALYTVNLSDFSISKVGDTSVTSNNPTALAYDAKTGLLYNITANSGRTSAFYAIDPATAEATHRYDFETMTEYGMLRMAEPAPAPAAPAAASALATSFDGPALSGTFSFLPPSTTVEGEAGSGPVAYSVTLNGKEIASGTTAYGAPAQTCDLAVPAVGFYDIIVTCSSGDLKGADAYMHTFIGTETPTAPANLGLAYAEDAFRLTWNAATASFDGYFDPELVTYEITRISEGESTVVAPEFKGTQFIDTYPVPASGLENVKYTVKARFAGNESELVTSNNVVLGSMEIPYFDNFPTEDRVEYYTIVDNNEDGACLEYIDNNHSLRYRYNPLGDADDYAIFPAAHLEAGKTYTASFMAGREDRPAVERVAMYVGRDRTPAALTTEILKPTTVEYQYSYSKKNGFKGLELSGSFTPEETGDYYFAVKVCSRADKYLLYISNFRVDLFPAPADLTGESHAAEGCDLSWTAADYEGYAALRNGGLDFKGYNVYRNGKKLNASPLKETAFHDPEYTENAAYTVTALYKQGESGVAGPLLLNKSGVDAVTAAMCVRGMKGAIEVAGAEMPVKVYDLQGRLLYKGGDTRIAASPGIYIVNVNGCNVKVIVR